MMENQPPNEEGAGGGDAPRPAFDPQAPNQTHPRLRPLQGFPVQREGQTYVALADAQQISDRVVFAAPAVQAVLPHMTGENDLDAIVQKVGRGLTRQWLENFVAQLDAAGLIEGPTFQRMLDEMRRQYDSKETLPPAATAQFTELLVKQKLDREQRSEFGETTEQASEEEATQEPSETSAAQTPDPEQIAQFGPDLLRGMIDQWIDEALKDAEDPSFDALPKAIVAPHIDYARGWHNYAHVYGRMRVMDRPARIVILGANHYGFSTGAAGCDKGIETPLGPCPLDHDFKERLCAALGDDGARRLFEHRFDHEREHSIELHLPWIQHVFGQDENGQSPPIFGALVHDPVRNNGESYDGQGLGLPAFVEGLKQAIAESPGPTLIVASADLSHVGQQFGDNVNLAGDEEPAVGFRNKVFELDREMLQLFAANPPEELVTSMAWRQNPTRWCSVGALAAAKMVAEPENVRLLQYGAAMDQQGRGMVSSCAMAMF